ncbi:hypothetical protein ACO0QE_002433 [Hanseniaspora vineae]
MNNNMNINIPRNISRFNTTNKNNYIDLMKSDVYGNGELIILDNDNIDIFYEYDKETNVMENDILVLDMSSTTASAANSLNINGTLSAAGSINLNGNNTDNGISMNGDKNASNEQLDVVMNEIISGCEKKYNITTMQLSFPYTLLKRSNFQLSKLIESTLYHNQQEQLLSSIQDSDIFIFYDNFNATSGSNNSSNACHCDISTYHIINKFITHLKATRKDQHDESGSSGKEYKVFYLNYQPERQQPSSPGLESKYTDNQQNPQQDPLLKQPTTAEDALASNTNTLTSNSPIGISENPNMFANNKEAYEKKLAALNKHRAAMHKSRIIAAGANSVPGSPTTISTPNGQSNSSTHKGKAHSRKLSLKLLIPNPEDQYTLNRISKSTPSHLGSPSAKDGSNGKGSINGKNNIGSNGKEYYMNKKSYGSSTNRSGARHFLKKDSCYYSPSTLNKYFSFTRPNTVNELNSSVTKSTTTNADNSVSSIQAQSQPTLPSWLDFLNDTSMNENDCLLQILERFQTLENLENDRLLKSMDMNREVEEVKPGSTTSTNNNITGTMYQFNYETLNTNQFYHLNTPDCRSCKNLDSADINASTTTNNTPASTPTYVFSQGIKYFNKNRYNNILPYEHTRVKLLAVPENNDTVPLNSPSGIYFNANHIRIPKLNPNYQYIATQAPLPSTFDDFWQVCLAEKIEFIISLNSMDELNLKKWDQYWNNDYLHQFHIEQVYFNDSVEDLNGCMLRVFEISQKISNACESSKNGKPQRGKIVYHLQYSNWFDSASVVSASIIEFMNIKNKLVNNPTAYIDYLKTFNSNSSSYTKSNPATQSSVKHYDTPLLVLCSAGCGRTGVFITIDFLLNLLNDHENPVRNIDFWKFPYDLIFIVVNELRRQRISMVQNLQQYIMCYQTIIEYLTHHYHAIANGSEGN